MIQLNKTTIWTGFAQYIYECMVLKIGSLKYFEQCAYIHFVQPPQPEYCSSKMQILGSRIHNFTNFKINKYFMLLK